MKLALVLAIPLTAALLGYESYQQLVYQLSLWDDLAIRLYGLLLLAELVWVFGAAMAKLSPPIQHYERGEAPKKSS